MKISNKITKQLGTLIAGDTSTAPYLSGPKLVDFYNECGFDDIYGEGFPSRWKYSTEKITESNGTPRLILYLGVDEIHDLFHPGRVIYHDISLT